MITYFRSSVIMPPSKDKVTHFWNFVKNFQRFTAVVNTITKLGAKRH